MSHNIQPRKPADRPMHYYVSCACGWAPEQAMYLPVARREEIGHVTVAARRALREKKAATA